VPAVIAAVTTDREKDVLCLTVYVSRAEWLAMSPHIRMSVLEYRLNQVREELLEKLKT